MTASDFLKNLQPIYWHPPAKATLANGTGLGKIAHKSPAAYNLVHSHFDLQTEDGQRNAVSAFSTLRLALESANLDADVITQGSKTWPTYWNLIKKTIQHEHRSIIDKFTNAAVLSHR